jgi:hypothetical protein
MAGWLVVLEKLAHPIGSERQLVNRGYMTVGKSDVPVALSSEKHLNRFVHGR